jgi:hypothetical protein
MTRLRRGVAPPRPAPHRARTRYRAAQRLRTGRCSIPQRGQVIHPTYQARAPTSAARTTNRSTPEMRASRRSAIEVSGGRPAPPFHVKRDPRRHDQVRVRHTYRSRAPSIPVRSKWLHIAGARTLCRRSAHGLTAKGGVRIRVYLGASQAACATQGQPTATEGRRLPSSPSGGRKTAETRRWSTLPHQPLRWIGVGGPGADQGLSGRGP